MTTIASVATLDSILPTLTTRTLGSANPALTNTFDANKTRNTIEVMNVFSETAMRIVGDVYKKPVDDAQAAITAATKALDTAKTGGNAATIAAAQTALNTANTAMTTVRAQQVLAHGVVGGFTAALGGTNPTTGFVGAVAGKTMALVTAELLTKSGIDPIKNPILYNQIIALSASAAGAVVGGSTGAFVASQGDRFNRQLHPSIQAFLTNRSTVQKYLDSEKAKGRAMSYDQAQDELFKAGAILNDATAASIIDSTSLTAAKDWLKANDVTTDKLGSYFNLDKNSAAYKNFNLYAIEALSGSGNANYEKYLSVNDPLYIKAIEQRLGELSGAKQVVVNFFKGLTQYPAQIAAAKDQIMQLLASDPQKVWAAIESAASTLPVAVKAEFDKQMAEYTLRTIYGEHDKASEIYTIAVLSVFDPGKKGAAVFDMLSKTATELAAIKKAGQALPKPPIANSILGQRPDGRTIRQVDAGQKGNWDRAINGKLDPNTAYQLSNGHTYLTDGTGRVTSVEGALTNTTFDRNKNQQCAAGKCGIAGDQGGHLIAASLGGAGDRINLVPQSAILNRGDYLAMENELRAAVQAGQSVSMKVDLVYPAGSGRPSTFNVVAMVGGTPREFKFVQ